MVTVPVYVPSYAQSGDKHVVAVGDDVAWALSILDMYLPEHLLQAAEFSTEFIEAPYPPLHYYPTLVRRGAFVAWWDPGKRVPEHMQLRPVCAIGDSRLPDEGIPEARGTVTQLYWTLDCLRQRSDGPWDIVPGVGLVEVSSTAVTPAQESFSAYLPGSDAAADGHWRHIGWIAMLRCD